MPSKFGEMKSEILSKYPSIETLGFWVRFKLWFDREFDTVCTDSAESETDRVSITYRLARYKGQSYFRQFGGL